MSAKKIVSNNILILLIVSLVVIMTIKSSKAEELYNTEIVANDIIEIQFFPFRQREQEEIPGLELPETPEAQDRRHIERALHLKGRLQDSLSPYIQQARFDCSGSPWGTPDMRCMQRVQNLLKQEPNITAIMNHIQARPNERELVMQLIDNVFLEFGGGGFW